MSSALASQPVLRDIRDVLPLEPATNITPLIVAAIFLCLALIGWLLYRWRKSRRKSPPPIPCWTTALKRLEQLEKDRSSIDANQYAKTLTTILKEYLEQRYGLHIQARTTEEFLPEIPSHDIPELRTKQSQLRILLEQTDLIKFAQAGIDDDLRNDMVQRLRDFIRQTIPTKGVQQ